jgi:hypothetical protein
MKKLIIGSLCMAIASAFALTHVEAAEGDYLYGTAGCGLGALLFKDKPGFLQVSAATTNGTYSNQSSGITSGTSNCVPDAKVNPAAYRMQRQEIFVHVNFESLEHEMAVGKGEKLAAFANLLGCPASHMAEFRSLVRTQHGKFFSNRENPTSMLNEVRASITTDKNLSRACKI